MPTKLQKFYERQNELIVSFEDAEQKFENAKNDPNQVNLILNE
jgi:hypothetical protein